MLKVVGETESVKFGAAFTVREISVEWIKLPDVPVMVTVKVPVAAVRLAVSVRVLVPVVLVGLKDPVTPLGRPDAVRLTLLAKPFRGFIMMVLAPLVPGVMLTVLGAAESA